MSIKLKNWKDFVKLESQLHVKNASTVEVTKITEDAKKWVDDFTDIYQRKNVTPYMHILTMHVPEFLRKYKSLVAFTLQGMEKLNDETTIDFTKSTNHNFRNLEALKQIMTKRNRTEHLKDAGYQQMPKQKKCSRCKSMGHNKRTCDNKSNE